MGQVIDFLPVEENLTGSLFTGETQDRAPGRCFAASGLSDQTHCGAPLEVECDAVDCLDVADNAVHHAALDREILLEAVDHQNILRIIGHRGDIGCLVRHQFSPPFSPLAAVSRICLSSGFSAVCLTRSL